MSKILAGFAAFALLLMLALPGPANAAERRADGLRSKDSAMTEFSSHRRRFRRVVVVRRPIWRPRAVYLGGAYPAYPYVAPLPYAYYPYVWRPRPVFAYGFGWRPRIWGPRWWW